MDTPTAIGIMNSVLGSMSISNPNRSNFVSAINAFGTSPVMSQEDALDVMDDVYWDMDSQNTLKSSMSDALAYLAETVNPDKPYPTVRG